MLPSNIFFILITLLVLLLHLDLYECVNENIENKKDKLLIYFTLSIKKEYIHLLLLLIKSIRTYGNFTGDLLLITDGNNNYTAYIEKKVKNISNDNDNIYFMYIKRQDFFRSYFNRLLIFSYKHINRYNKILYLDSDILILNNINKIFMLLDKKKEDKKVYSVKEGSLDNPWWGGTSFFTKKNLEHFKKAKQMDAFNAGILLFQNNKHIVKHFDDMIKKREEWLNLKKPIPVCLDQCFIVYVLSMSNSIDNQKMNKYVDLNPTTKLGNNNMNKTIFHFQGQTGNPSSKILKIFAFIKKNNLTHLSIKMPSK